MPKTIYTSEQKKLARRLLIIHGGDVGIVHHLTAIPKRTLYDWRAVWDDDYDLYMDAFAQKIINHADAKRRIEHTATPHETDDETSAQPQNTIAQLKQVRETLMQHVTTLANNLMLGDGYINHRVIALTRLLDRILQLEAIITKDDPEREHIVRFEYYYDGEVHNVPPWQNDPHDDTP